MLLALAGCGGSRSSTYDKSTLVGCLQQHGAQLVFPRTVTSLKRLYWVGGLGSPNWVIARFSRRGFDTFLFTPDAAGTKKLADNEAGSDSDGNLVHIRTGRVTSAAQKVVSACEEQARQT